MTDIIKRAAEFIRMHDPFGDIFSEHALLVLAGEPTSRLRECGGPTERDPDRPYCKLDQSCCDFCCGN